MSVKRTVRQQYQAVVNRAAGDGKAFGTPSEGWQRTARKSLGMSGAKLARRMGVTRARISNVEKDELRGAVTLQSMQTAAEAMGCRFVYAIVPPETAEELIAAQARRRRPRWWHGGRHMALESQALPTKLHRVRRLTRDFVYEMPSDFWDDK